MFSKKGLSNVVVMVIMIALVLAIMILVYNLVISTVEEQTEKAESCGIDLIEKVYINDDYVCYNSSSKEVIFSISIGDILLDELLVVISDEGSSKTFTLANESSEDIHYFNGTKGKEARIPGPKSGKTYIVNVTGIKPTQMQIAPVVNGNQCDVIDKISNIVDCSNNPNIQKDI